MLGNIGPMGLILLLVVVVLLFGRGKISELMGDVAKGIKSFKKGMKDDEIETAEAVERNIDAPQQPIDVTPAKDGEKAS